MATVVLDLKREGNARPKWVIRRDGRVVRRHARHFAAEQRLRSMARAIAAREGVTVLSRVEWEGGEVTERTETPESAAEYRADMDRLCRAALAAERAHREAKQQAAIRPKAD